MKRRRIFLLLALALSVVAAPASSRATPSSVEVRIGHTTATLEESTADFDTTLATGTNLVVGLDFRFSFDPSAPVAAKENGTPECTVNPAINKRATSFAFLPRDCGEDFPCDSVDVVVLDLSNLAPIPDGSRLFTCTVALSGETGTFPLGCIAARYSTPPPSEGIDAACSDGSVVVSGGCVGDCNADGDVTIDESLTGVNIALGPTALSECPAADADGDGTVAITDLVLGIGSALRGCAP